MIHRLGAAALLALLVPAAAAGQEIRALSVLSGNEIVVLRPNLLNADCSSGERPDVRVISKPVHGSVRMEPITITVNRPRTDSRAHCNGKQVDALGVYYRAQEGAAGVERLVLLTDFRTGTVREFVILVDVR